MTPKMIFFDIDGTLIPEGDTVISQSTKNAIAKARANGHLTFINTGRTFFNIDPFILDLGFDGLICGCGTYIYYHGQKLFSHTIPHDRCVETIHMMRKLKIPGFFEENTHIYFDEELPSTGFIDELRRMFKAKNLEFSIDIKNPSFTYDKILVHMNQDSDERAFKAYISPFLDYIDRGNQITEIVQKGYSKATGIQFMCDYLNIPLKNCYAIGDSTNDLPMLAYVPNSIAMGNSMPEILPFCTWQTRDVDKDGIEFALKHYHIID